MIMYDNVVVVDDDDDDVVVDDDDDLKLWNPNMNCEKRWSSKKVSPILTRNPSSSPASTAFNFPPGLCGIMFRGIFLQPKTSPF